jgi:hypothetical protein
MRYGGLKILSEKKAKRQKLYKNIPKYTTYCSLNMGHTTEKKRNVLLMIILLPCQA